MNRPVWAAHPFRAWAPLTFTDEDPPARAGPVAPARRSARAHAKASFQGDEFGHPYRSFRGLLAHLATLTPQPGPVRRNPGPVPILAEPSPGQCSAFELIGATIPLTLK